MTPGSNGLGSQQLEQYRTAGYVAVRGRFTGQDVANWQHECDRLWAVVESLGEDGRVQQRGQVGGGTVADRLDRVMDLSTLFATVARDERMVAAVRAALGAEPALVKDKLICKRPDTMGYGMHQDYPYWERVGIPADELLTVLLAIDDADQSNGSLEVFSGLHHARIEAPPDDPLDADERKMDLSRGERVDLTAGDFLMFHSMAPHRSGPNTSSRSRRALFLTYSTARHGEVYARFHPGTGTR